MQTSHLDPSSSRSLALLSSLPQDSRPEASWASSLGVGPSGDDPKPTEPVDTTFTSLPEDMQRLVLNKLDLKDKLSASQVSSE